MATYKVSQDSSVPAAGSALVQALDQQVPLVAGENGAAAYARVAGPGVIGKRTGVSLLEVFAKQLTRGQQADLWKVLAEETNEAKAYAIVLCFYSRSIKNGAGERDVFFNMFGDLLQLFPHTMLSLLPLIPNEDVAGTWNDFGRLIEFLETKHPHKDKLVGQIAALKTAVVQLAASQLVKDHTALQTDPQAKISLAAKYVPSEGTHHWDRYGKDLVREIHYLTSGQLVASKEAFLGACKKYRLMLSPLRARANVVEKLMCEGRFKDINYSTVPSGAMRTYGKRAFRNLTKEQKPRSEAEDRVEAAKRYQEHLDKAKAGDKTAKVHGGRLQTLQLPDMLKAGGDEVELQVADLIRTILKEMKQRVKESTNELGDPTLTLDLGKMVVMADVSGSMEVGIAGDVKAIDISALLGFLVSQLAAPAWRDRVLTFSGNANWNVVDTCKTLSEKFRQIRYSKDWGSNTDFQKAYERILTTIEQAKLPREDVEGLTFLVLSDMQFDMAGGPQYYNYGHQLPAAPSGWEPHLATITKRFAEVGVKLTGQPYPVPHMVFWNLAGRPTSGFEAKFDTPGVTMLSGFGIGQLKDVLSGRNLFTSPLVKLFQTLNAPHYKLLREAVAQAQTVQPELPVPEGFVAGRYGIPEDLLEPIEVIPDSAVPAGAREACSCGDGCKGGDAVNAAAPAGECGSDCPCRTGGKCNGSPTLCATCVAGVATGFGCECEDICCKSGDAVNAAASAASVAPAGKWFGLF